MIVILLLDNYDGDYYEKVDDGDDYEKQEDDFDYAKDGTYTIHNQLAKGIIRSVIPLPCSFIGLQDNDPDRQQSSVEYGEILSIYP